MAVKAVEQIARAISEGFKLVAQVMSGAEKRRMRKAIEYGERFIRRTRKQYPELADSSLDKYERAFYKYNN